MIAVKQIDPLELHRFYKGEIAFQVPVWGYAARRGLLTTGIGGVFQGLDGRVWGFMDFRPGYRGKILYRYMIRLLREAEETGIPHIYVVRDHAHETSERMLQRGGFIKTEEQLADHEIWVWHNPRVNER